MWRDTLAKTMTKVVSGIFLNLIPIILMIGLIPLVQNDYILAAICLAIIAASLLVKYEKGDVVFLIFGLVIMTIMEYFFVSAGSEIFTRQTLLGVMPLWLPVMWGYGFVAMRRGISIIDEYLE